jgi:hypothetical protein
MGGGLSHRTPWQKVTVAERAGRIHEDQIQISLKGQMLESVIQDEEIGAVLLFGQQTGLVATLS